jgi:hypothetical protein
MKYIALKPLKTRKSEYRIGDIIETSDKGVILPLIEQGFLKPLERAAYKIYSETLGCSLWVVETDRDMHALRSQGVSEAIYTTNEIEKLRTLSPSEYELRIIHGAKDTLLGTVSDIQKEKPIEPIEDINGSFYFR